MAPPVTIRVDLTEDHVPNDKRHCPIADALRLSDADILIPVVDRDYINFSRRSSGMRLRYMTPQNAKAYVDALDKGETPEPIILKLTDKNLLWEKPRREAVNPDRVTRVPGQPIKPLGETKRYRVSIYTA